MNRVLEVDDRLLGVAEGGEEFVYQRPGEVDDGINNSPDTCHRYPQGVGHLLVLEEGFHDRREDFGHQTDETRCGNGSPHKFESIGTRLARLLEKAARLLRLFTYILCGVGGILCRVCHILHTLLKLTRGLEYLACLGIEFEYDGLCSYSHESTVLRRKTQTPKKAARYPSARV